MKNMREKFKNICMWIFSNTLWTIVTFISPISFIINPIKNIIYSISDKSYSIKLIYIIPIVFFIIIETIICVCLIIVKKRNKLEAVSRTINPQNDIDELTITTIESNKEQTNCDDINLVYQNLDYYFEEYSKHVTIYKNGNGIIINSFTIVINDINSISQFKRELNIKDSCKDTHFPELNQMLKNNIDNRFDDFVFKCRCINNRDLIDSIEEKYWTDNADDGDNISQNDTKILKWILKMNLSSVKVGEPYRIVYVISIPKMCPIDNGFFDEKIANLSNSNGVFTSGFCVGHKIKKFLYTISFENGIDLDKKPKGTVSNSNHPSNITFVNDNNIIYNKYIFGADHLDDGSSINIEWRFKKVSNQKGGRTHGRVNSKT